MRNLKRLQKTSIFGWALAALAVWTPGKGRYGAGR